MIAAWELPSSETAATTTSGSGVSTRTYVQPPKPTPLKHFHHANYNQGSSESIKVPARSKWSEPFREPCEGCGISYKVSKTDQLEGGKQTQFEYAIAGGQLWYDISFVDCAKGDSADDCPGHDKGLAMDSPNVRAYSPLILSLFEHYTNVGRMHAVRSSARVARTALSRLTTSIPPSRSSDSPSLSLAAVLPVTEWSCI